MTQLLIDTFKKFTVTKAVVILSGGMDSTIALRFAYEKYFETQVFALSFNYGQKQSVELKKAKETCEYYSISHKVVDLAFLGEISKNFSANVQGSSIKMPTIKEVLGQPMPQTYIPNRNMIMLSIATAYAETIGADVIICGVQARDEYSYHDTIPQFITALNMALVLNRIHPIKILAPFNDLTKKQEIELLVELDGNVDLLKKTITCYAPTGDISCGVCPSCAERVKNFMDAGYKDPIPYAIESPWGEAKSAI